MSNSMLIYAPAYGDGPAFILSCDEAALRWLAASFRRADKGHAFSLGDGSPIASDGKCIIQVDVVPDACKPVLRTAGVGRFEWRLPATLAGQYADLVEGVADFAGACHQYLEAAQPGTFTFIVSKGEYDTATLCDMRNALVRT